MNGCEQLTIGRLVRDHVQAAEVWFYTRTMRINLGTYKYNQDIAKGINLHKELVTRNEGKQTIFWPRHETGRTGACPRRRGGGTERRY